MRDWRGPGDGFEGRDDFDESESDARPLHGHPRSAAQDPETAAARRLRRGLFFAVLGAVFLAGSVTAIFGRGGLDARNRLAAERRLLEREVEERAARVAALEREVRDLRGDPMARERIAREQLGYALPGEMLFLLPRETPPAVPAP